jgi:hypothetical protein
VREAGSDWERRYRTAVACAECGRTDLHASDCPLLREKERKLRRFGAPIALVAIAVAIWQGAIGDLAVAAMAGTIGCAMAALVVERAHRSR